jgi:WD40 repeat protein
LAVRHSQGTDVYNLNSGHLRFQIPNSLAGTYFSPGGRFMALPSGTNVLVLSCTDGSVAAQHVVQDGQVITAATWVDDEDHFAIALQQNRSEVYGCEIRILDLPQGAIRNKLYGHFHHISGLDYLPGKVLASTGWDGSTVLWDTASAAKLLELKIGGGSVHLSPDGRRILWESPGRSALVVWRSELTPELTRLDLPSHGWPLDLSPYGLLATESNTRKSWFIPSLSLTANYRLADGLYAILTAADLSCTYALGNGPTGYGLLFRSPLEYDFTKQQLFSGPPSLLPLGTKEADWLRLSPDGHHALVRHKSGFCIVHWEGSPSVTWPTGGWPTDFSISREGRLVASAHPTGMSPPGIRVWDGLTGALMHELPNSRRDVSPRLSPDGRWLLTHCRDQSGFRLYEAPNWVLRRTFTNDFHKSAVAEFNQEGSIATLFYSDRSMVFMETRTWNEICRIPFGGNLNRALFSTDDSQFVMGSESGHTEIWDLRLVRSRLSAMGLDFPVPSLPEPAPSAGINPRQLVIRPGMHLLPVANP